MSPPRSTAILIVNGYDRRNRWGRFDPSEVNEYPWIDLCLRQIRRHTEPHDADVFVYDNARLTKHRDIIRAANVKATFPSDRTAGLLRPLDAIWPAYTCPLLVKSHPDALDYLADKVAGDYRWFITLDSDAFPIRDGWVQALTSQLERGASIVGIWRDEMRTRIRPFVHVSGLCMETRRFEQLQHSFARGITQDLGQNITEELLGHDETVVALRRTNVNNPHFLMAGVYGNLLYHHGAGSRRATFWTSKEEADEVARVALMRRAFGDLDGLVGELMACDYDALPGPELSVV